MTVCAVVQISDNIVVNKIVAEPTDLAPNDTYLVVIPDGVMCDMGWTWNKTEFVNPNPPPVEEPINGN